LIVIAQKPTQSLAAPYRPLAVAVHIPRKQQNIALPLVIPLRMEMLDIVAQRPPQGAPYGLQQVIINVVLNARDVLLEDPSRPSTGTLGHIMLRVVAAGGAGARC
jgi:hypothetical protein